MKHIQIWILTDGADHCRTICPVDRPVEPDIIFVPLSTIRLSETPDAAQIELDGLHASVDESEHIDTDRTGPIHEALDQIFEELWGKPPTAR